MPVFAGLVSYLALSGTTGLPPGDYAKTLSTSARPDDGTFTRLSLNGTAGRNYGTFAAKDPATADARSVTDTYMVRLQFGDVSEVSAATTDRYVAVLSLASVAGDTKAVTDTYVPVLIFGIAGMDKAAITPIAGSDTYVPALTFEASTVSYNAAGTDSYVPVLSLAITASPSDALEMSDTYVPVLGMNYVLQTVVASVSRSVIDSYVPVLTFNATLFVSGDVDGIRIEERPYGIIRIREI